MTEVKTAKYLHVLIADLLFIRHRLKRGIVIGIEKNTIEKLFKKTKKVAGVDFSDLSYIKTAGENVYYIARSHHWYSQCLLEWNEAVQNQNSKTRLHWGMLYNSQKFSIGIYVGDASEHKNPDEEVEEHVFLGTYCGFPPCCIEAYVHDVNAGRNPVERFLKQEGSEKFMVEKYGHGYAQNSIVSWIPCSPACKATWRYVRRAKRILRRYPDVKVPLPAF